MRYRTVTSVTLPALLTFLLIACGGSDSNTGPSDEESGATYQVSGVVEDSITEERVEGATVSVAGQTGTTDFNGEYQLTGIEEGSHTLEVATDIHRELSRSVSVQADLRENVQLIRVAPWLEDFYFTAGGDWAHAQFVDMSGVDNLPGESSQVWARFVYGTSIWVVGSSDFSDNGEYTRTYHFAVDAPYDSASISIEDADGHQVSFLCQATDWDCEETTGS